MPRNNAEYSSRQNTEYEDEDKNDGRYPDLTKLTGKDPTKHNDRIIDAFYDLGYSTRDFAKPESYPRSPKEPAPEGIEEKAQHYFSRASSFAFEMSKDSLTYQNGKTILDEIDFKEKYGKDWNNCLEAATVMSEIIQEGAESKTALGIMAADEKEIAGGRRMLQDATQAAQEMRDDPEKCRKLAEAWGKMGWPGMESGPEGHQESSQAQFTYLRMIRESVNDEKLAESVQWNTANSMAEEDSKHAIEEIHWSMGEAARESKGGDRNEENQLFYHAIEQVTKRLLSTQDSHENTPIDDWELCLSSQGEHNTDAPEKLLHTQEILVGLVKSTLEDYGQDQTPKEQHTLEEVKRELAGQDTRTFGKLVWDKYLEEIENQRPENQGKGYEEESESYSTPTAEVYVHNALTINMIENLDNAMKEMKNWQNEEGGQIDQAARYYLTAMMMQDARQESTIQDTLTTYRERTRPDNTAC
jgi:hypothetical protein